MFPAEEFIRERYAPFRAEHGKHIPFESAEFRSVVSPYDGKSIANVGFMSEAQALENLETLCLAHRLKRVPKTHLRIDALKETARRLRERADAFADLIAWEGGKPIKDARIEVARAAQTLEWAGEEAGRIAGREVPMRASAAASGHLAFTFTEPIGVALAISAFNHPLNLIAHQIAPAIAVGCPVMVKPASVTPLSCLHLLDLLYESGLPPEMCLPLVAENEVAERIARSPRIAFLNFIGSARVGWHLRSLLAPGTRFALEHGGSAPVLIDESADLERAVALLLKGAFYHSGQVCVSVQRIFVHEKMADEFVERFVLGMRALKVGDPRLETTDCGPIIRVSDRERIHSRVEQAKQAGARIILGRHLLEMNCYAPTLIDEPDPQSAVVREEIFGPVACLSRFSDLDDAIARANEVDWSFQAAVFSNDLERALRAVKGLRASAVMVNESTTFRVDWMPFRGDGPSGFGTGGIPFTMHDLVKEKLAVFRTSAFEL